ncbi:Hypothetical predicted protein [Olea europaea subsp. europaea]|uniref:Uncharacterized protein n=1 Tax=Olea europaea subsp. europaea TaxID=158383 RepID=A0A8S0UAQ8_OLEEU|nr:Hypothetical predicted protein [Olea europaea subsp. europaea]
MTTGRINQVAFLFDVDIARTEVRGEEERRSHAARNARSGVIGGSASSYPLGVPHPRIRARRRGPSPAPGVANGVERDAYHESSQQRAEARVDLLSNKCVPSGSRGLLHVLALEILRLSK